MKQMQSSLSTSISIAINGWAIILAFHALTGKHQSFLVHYFVYQFHMVLCLFGLFVSYGTRGHRVENYFTLQLESILKFYL